MKLASYLSAVDMSAEAFAVAIGVTAVSVGRYVKGQRTPERDVMRRIIEVTDGRVTANDFLDSPTPLRRARRRRRASSPDAEQQDKAA